MGYVVLCAKGRGVAISALLIKCSLMALPVPSPPTRVRHLCQKGTIPSLRSLTLNRRDGEETGRGSRTTGAQKYEDLERSFDVFAGCTEGDSFSQKERQKKKEEGRKRGRRRGKGQCVCVCVCSHDHACLIQGLEGDFSSLSLVNQHWREAAECAASTPL